jgi:type I restriction enzyme S subunit
MTDRDSTIPPIDILPEHWQIVRRILNEHVPHHEIWAFGSRARGNAKPYSDLDLAVIADAPLSIDIRAAMAEDFTESDLPWKVDVVDWATTSDTFRKIIEQGKVLVRSGAMPRFQNPRVE